MNIGFYGHSNCAYRSVDSFLDIVSNHYLGKIVNTGCKQGSEERILFELKKTKQLDLAIIFHCHHSSLFVPEGDRDIHINLDTDKATDLFRNDHLDSEFTNANSPKFRELFQTDENLANSIDSYRKYFYHKDLLLNRYYGSLLQIDQYLKYKNIKHIHVLDNSCVIPSWFVFNGYVDNSIMEICKEHTQKNPFFVNCISKLGNQLVANKLIEIINSL